MKTLHCKGLHTSCDMLRGEGSKTPEYLCPLFQRSYLWHEQCRACVQEAQEEEEEKAFHSQQLCGQDMQIVFELVYLISRKKR